MWQGQGIEEAEGGLMSGSGLRTRPVILCRHHLTSDNSVAAVNALSSGGYRR